MSYQAREHTHSRRINRIVTDMYARAALDAAFDPEKEQQKLMALHDEVHKRYFDWTNWRLHCETKRLTVSYYRMLNAYNALHVRVMAQHQADAETSIIELHPDRTDTPMRNSAMRRKHKRFIV